MEYYSKGVWLMMDITEDLIKRIDTDLDMMEEELNKRIISICKDDNSHTKELSKND